MNNTVDFLWLFKMINTACDKSSVTVWSHILFLPPSLVTFFTSQAPELQPLPSRLIPVSAGLGPMNDLAEVDHGVPLPSKPEPTSFSSRAPSAPPTTWASSHPIPSLLRCLANFCLFLVVQAFPWLTQPKWAVVILEMLHPSVVVLKSQLNFLQAVWSCTSCWNNLSVTVLIYKWGGPAPWWRGVSGNSLRGDRLTGRGLFSVSLSWRLKLCMAHALIPCMAPDPEEVIR